MGKQTTGFITIYRQMIDWEWYKNSSVKDVFLHLLLTANFADGRFKGQLIKRGQCATSLPSLSSETGLSIQQVRTALRHLSATGEITDNANRRYRVITVVKYDDYQNLTDKPTYKSTDNQQSTNSQLTDNQQTINRQLTDNQQQYNNNNNITKEQCNKGTIKKEPRDAGVEDSWFSEFWEAYPRKVDKQSAVRAWKKIKPDASLMAKIMEGLRRWKESEQWLKENGQYIPYPATWLNKRRWEDEVKKAAPPAPQRRIMPAENFEQRDYSDVPADDMARLAADIQAAREAGII